MKRPTSKLTPPAAWRMPIKDSCRSHVEDYFSINFSFNFFFFRVATFSNISERRRPLRDGQDVNKIGLLFFESETARAL